MGFKVTIHSSVGEELAEKLGAASGKAAHTLAQQIQKDTEPFVPADTKSLVNRTKAKGNMIIYPGPYARFLYYGKLMIDPATGSAFARKGATKVVTEKNLKYRKDVHSQAQSHWFEASKAQNMDKWRRVARKAMLRNV